MESITVITEPLLNPQFVQFEIVVPILERLKTDYDITVAAPRIAGSVRRALTDRGIGCADGGGIFPRPRRARDEIPSYVASWFRDSLFGLNRRAIERALPSDGSLRINISMTTACDADVWFIQSRPLGEGIDAIRRGTRRSLRLALSVIGPIVAPLDEHHLKEAWSRSRQSYASTEHVGKWFSDHGMAITGQIPVYIRPGFEPSTPAPSRNYLLTYLGKETDSDALRRLLETGIPVKMFGSKSPGWVRRALELESFPNAEMLGGVSDAQLRDLYTNAKFTAFPFTEESFGLIPVESMACGTPVLTYGRQGPAETVVNGETGWLVETPAEFAGRATELWHDGYPAFMRERCLDRASLYTLDAVVGDWKEMIRSALDRRAGPVAAGRVVSEAVKPIRAPLVRNAEPRSGASEGGGATASSFGL